MPKFQTPPIQGQKFLEGDEPSYPWLQWFELLASALSTAPVPANSAAAGIPGIPLPMTTDGTYLYVYVVSANQWKRVALTAF